MHSPNRPGQLGASAGPAWDPDAHETQARLFSRAVFILFTFVVNWLLVVGVAFFCLIILVVSFSAHFHVCLVVRLVAWCFWTTSLGNVFTKGERNEVFQSLVCPQAVLAFPSVLCVPCEQIAD